MIGTSVDRYRIVEELGHGGMSVVYRGVDSALERDVAVKVLHNHLAKKAENRQRFHREAKAIARLRHPNILEIYDFSSADAERSYIVMEYVEGENLRQFAARTGHPPPEVAALICLEIAYALEHAHDHGIIHRDLKPENVMVSSGGELKLMDFGIAHVIDAETMTATGSLMGSPAHMAPEIIDGQRADVRADVFALGTVLYWLAAGRLPFEGANAPQVLRKVLEGDCEDVESVDPRTGQQLGAIVRRCLATDPDDRYESVLAVRRELADFIGPMGWTDYELELKRLAMRYPGLTKELTLNHQTVEGRDVVVVEDTSTTGGSALTAVEALQRAGANVVAVAIIVDRRTGAKERIEETAGVPCLYAFTKDELGLD